MSGRMGYAKNGKFSNKEEQTETGAVAFAWFVWEKRLHWRFCNKMDVIQ